MVGEWKGRWAPKIDRFPDDVRKAIRSSDAFFNENYAWCLVEEERVATWDQIGRHVRWVGNDVKRGEKVEAVWGDALALAYQGSRQRARSRLAAFDVTVNQGATA